MTVWYGPGPAMLFGGEGWLRLSSNKLERPEVALDGMGWPVEAWNGISWPWMATLPKRRSIQVYSWVAGRDAEHSDEEPYSHIARCDQHVGATLCSQANELGEKHDSISQNEVSVQHPGRKAIPKCLRGGATRMYFLIVYLQNSSVSRNPPSPPAPCVCRPKLVPKLTRN